MLIMINRKKEMTEEIELPNQEKSQNTWRKGNLLWNIESRHHQASKDERQKLKRIHQENEKNYSKPNYIAEISSMRQIPGQSSL